MRDAYLTPASPYEGGGRGGSSLESSIFDTVRFFDLYDMPVTATQIWEYLVVSKSGYRHHPGLQEVQHTLASSEFLQERMNTTWGYHFLRGRQQLVRQRLVRHAIAQQKWKIVMRCAPLLAWLPFVRALAVSGSLAADNTKPSSDLDMLIIVREGKIWTARLFLLLMAQLLGRRRTYDVRTAPDMLCLNQYFTEHSLLVAKETRNICMAIQYACLVPIYNNALFDVFIQRNAFWVTSFLHMRKRLQVPHRYTIQLHVIASFWKRHIEALLLEPLGDMVERYAELLQRAIITRHGGLSKKGRIMLSYHELAFHPDAKEPAIVLAFNKK